MAITRHGLYGGARPPYGDFTGKELLATLAVSRRIREVWEKAARATEDWHKEVRVRNVWSKDALDTEDWSGGL